MSIESTAYLVLVMIADVIVGKVSRAAQSAQHDTLTAQDSARQVGAGEQFLFKDSHRTRRALPLRVYKLLPPWASTSGTKPRLLLPTYLSSLNTIINDALFPGRAPFTMSLLTHGGRIVPILTGHEQQPPDSTRPNTDELEYRPLAPTNDESLLLEESEEALEALALGQNKALDLKSLEMPCLVERGLFALPTEGDGKHVVWSEPAALTSCMALYISFLTRRT